MLKNNVNIIKFCYEDAFEQTITLKPYSSTAKEINYDKIPFCCLEKDYFLIVYSTTLDEPYVPTVLIDFDYPNKPYFTIFNPTDKEVKLERIKFFIDFVFKTNNIDYGETLFFQTENSGPIDGISSLKIQSKEANGIDVEFEKCYSIKPKSNLIINLPFEPSQLLAECKHLFVPRSRFARIGLQVVSFEKNQLVLFNSSSTEIDLGDRFFQIVLPTPLAFCLSEHLLEDLFGNFKKIKFFHKKKKRKPKNFKFSN